jgi:hypothetical protein
VKKINLIITSYALSEGGYTLKALRHRARREDAIAQARYAVNIAGVPIWALIFLDETHLSRSDFRRRRGRSRRGTRATAHDFIPGKSYNLSVLTCCNVDGFVQGGACKVLDHNSHSEGEAVTDKDAVLAWIRELIASELKLKYFKT